MIADELLVKTACGFVTAIAVIAKQVERLGRFFEKGVDRLS